MARELRFTLTMDKAAASREQLIQSIDFFIVTQGFRITEGDYEVTITKMPKAKKKEEVDDAGLLDS